MKLKLVLILIIIVNMIFFNINIVQAESYSDIIKGGDSFLSSGKTSDIIVNESKLKGSSEIIYNILLIFGMCIAVVISAILGIKFMIGSVEEKAEIKDSLIPFIIGCIVVFGAFGIWKIFVTIGNRL